MVTVAVDGNGADLGPEEVAKGAAIAAAGGVRVLLYADASRITTVADGVEVIDAPVSIAKTGDPAYAVRSTPEASIVQATRAVASGEAQALVSGGSTGPALAAGLFHIKRDRGIYRPALALPLPRPGNDPLLLLDVGANVECRPEHLIQFAHMGSAFAQAVLGIERPRVALLSNGEEPAKGTPDLKYVHERLAGEAGAGLRFMGNVEGTQVMGDAVDVVIADGFIGNIALKLIEGVSSETLRLLRNAAGRSLRAKVGGFLLKPSIQGLRDEIDPEVTGGAYMLGLRQIGIVCHGRFTSRGFGRAIEVAARGVEEDVIGRTRAALAEAGALRRAPSADGDASDPEPDPPKATEAASPSGHGATVGHQ
jgi:glycerol-3-phosphate acyltransferase PlsX